MSRFVHVLSVRQPWAWLICAGFKDVENRTWNTLWRGELYIHAGKSFDWEAMEWLEWDRPSIANKIKQHFRLDRSMVATAHKLHQDMMHEFGAIVGKVTLHDVTQNATSKWAEPLLYHWIVKRPVEIEPISMKGKLGIFRAEIPDEIKVIGNLAHDAGQHKATRQKNRFRNQPELF